MPGIETPEKITDFPLAVVKSMVGLATSGFGVVVALAWNDLIRRAVEQFIDPYLGKNSGLASLFIYSIVVTVLAVIVTMQLAYMQKKLEILQEKILMKNKKKDC
jgi:hypothetical protein